MDRFLWLKFSLIPVVYYFSVHCFTFEKISYGELGLSREIRAVGRKPPGLLSNAPGFAWANHSGDRSQTVLFWRKLQLELWRSADSPDLNPNFFPQTEFFTTEILENLAMGLLQGAGFCKLMPDIYGKFHEKKDGATKNTWYDLSNSK